MTLMRILLITMILAALDPDAPARRLPEHPEVGLLDQDARLARNLRSDCQYILARMLTRCAITAAVATVCRSRETNNFKDDKAARPGSSERRGRAGGARARARKVHSL